MATAGPKTRAAASPRPTADVYRRQKLQEAIWTPLSVKYIPAKELEPTAEELKEFTVRLRQANTHREQEQQDRQKTRQTEADRLERLLPSQDERVREGTAKRIRQMREEIAAIEESLEIDGRKKAPLESEQLLAKWWVGHWKQQQWFYKRYGGRVIYQQVGPEAIDAMRDFLKESEAKKDFAIYDQDLKASFWEPFIGARQGVFVPNPDKAFEHPWSIMDRSVNDEKPTAPSRKP